MEVKMGKSMGNTGEIHGETYGKNQNHDSNHVQLCGFVADRISYHLRDLLGDKN